MADGVGKLSVDQRVREGDHVVQPGADDPPVRRARGVAAGHRDRDGQIVIHDSEAKLFVLRFAALYRTDQALAKGEYPLAAIPVLRFRILAVQREGGAVTQELLEGEQCAETVGRGFLVFREEEVVLPAVERAAARARTRQEVARSGRAAWEERAEAGGRWFRGGWSLAKVRDEELQPKRAKFSLVYRL